MVAGRCRSLRKPLHALTGVVLILIGHVTTIHAQEYAGGPPAPATYDLRASAAFPAGLGVSASMRLIKPLSVEAGIGFLPVSLQVTAGLNLHVRPSYELDPAISILGTYMKRKGDDVLFGSLMYGFLESRKTGFHIFLRAGLSAMYIEKRFFPAPAADFGFSFGIR